MTLEFNYRKELENNHFTVRPKIIVTLFTEHNELDVIALIDSGSDIIYLPFSVAHTLGLNLEGESGEVYGTSKISTVKTNINFYIEKENNKYVCTEKEAMIGLEELGYLENEIILGKPFFEEFQITFNIKQEKIYLEKI